MSSSTEKFRNYLIWIGAILLLILAVLCGVYGRVFQMFPNYMEGGQTNVYVETWRDDDANGIWEATEPALPFTQVFADDLTGNNDPFVITTNADGRGLFELWLVDRTHTFFADTPSGYQLTTPEQVHLDITELDDVVVRFGFALLPGQPTPTPIPRAELTCHQIYAGDIEKGFISEMHLGPAGSVVLPLRDRPEMRHYAADGAFLSSLPLVPDRPTGLIAFAPDGSYWMAGPLLSDGLAQVEDVLWRIEDPYKQPGAHDVDSITVAPDGDVWLGTDIGAFQLDEATGKWSHFAANRSICDVMPAADGAIWLLACDWSIVRLTPGGPRLYEGDEVARMSDPQLTHGDLLGAVLEDTGVWLIGSSGLAWWDSITSEWTIYMPATTANAFPPYHVVDFARAADGALWLMTPNEGLIRARPKDGEWTLVNAPALFESTNVWRQMVIAGDGSIWTTYPAHIVYRCEL